MWIVAHSAVDHLIPRYNRCSVLLGSNFTVYGERKIPFRSIGINFTCKFGKLEFKKGNDEGADSNLNVPAQ